ncbi:MAG: ATP-dependent helicase, partial [Cyanobacteriota bacterium]|nr:ATP-dependent helicase [Cyanobacteriota bacterium]
GSQANKQAILYEVVTENTAEERTAQRRKGQTQYSPSQKKSQPKSQQLELLKYGTNTQPAKRAAESSGTWKEDEDRRYSENEEE